MYHDSNTRKPLSNFTELKENSFIFLRKNALPKDICREMIRRFESDKESQYQGRIGQNFQEDANVKKSTDLAISAHENWRDISSELVRSLGAFPFFKGPFKDVGYNLQRTNKGEYYNWHIDGGSHDFANRQLAVIWYLNDVEGPGGTTDFLFQDISIQPTEGSMVLFPTFWTHEHRNSQLQNGVKYIATTWLSFA